MVVDVLALDGVLDSGLAVTRDLLAAANRIACVRGKTAPFRTRLVSPLPSFRTGTGLVISADRRLRLRDRRDVLVVLGMNTPTPDELDAALARTDVAEAIGTLRREAKRGTLILASCAGTFLCAEAGLLDGDSATTTWWLAPHFRRRYPKVVLRDDAMVVAGKQVVTAGAALSQVDLMLWLVRRVAGPTIADLCARYLVVDERPSQAPYLVVDHLRHQSDIVQRAEAFARRSLHEEIAVADLARAAGTSSRTLERRFDEAMGMSPVRFLQRLRAEKALHLLRTTRLNLDQVAERVGYADPVSLRRVLKRETNLTVRAVRGSPQRSPSRT